MSPQDGLLLSRLQPIPLLLGIKDRRQHEASKVLQHQDSGDGSNGNLLMNGDGTFQYVKRLTKWTCYNAAHKFGQTTTLGKRRSELINIARGIAPGAGGEEDTEADDGIAIKSAADSANGVAAAPGAAPR